MQQCELQTHVHLILQDRQQVQAEHLSIIMQEQELHASYLLHVGAAHFGIQPADTGQGKQGGHNEHKL